MDEHSTQPPDLVPDTSDPGDDTGRRYRYQWTYAAILCCSLLDDTLDIDEVFCEHHEDVLLKHENGTFTGVQVKTKALDQDVWKTSDEPFRKSCVRFIELDVKFPGFFKAFRFATNHPLHSSSNGKDIRFVLNSIRKANSVSELANPVSKFVGTIAKKANSSKEFAFATLSKIMASADLPKLKDIDSILVNTLIPVWEAAGEITATSVQRAAKALAYECERASTLGHSDILPAYLCVVDNPIEAELKARLDGKKINASRVLDVLDSGVNTTALLEGSVDAIVNPGEGKASLLMQKLNAGGFSAVFYNSAQDLRDKADYLGISWIKKYGREKGLKRYDHVRSLVLNDSLKSLETTKTDEHLFGLNMLNEFLSRINERRKNGSQLFDCSDEHLEGFAYSLTSQCKVQWSIERPWEEED